jgi:phosphatidylethanolamine/phosphatidyl-N-methylethanolamine N-methyltransferase
MKTEDAATQYYKQYFDQCVNSGFNGYLFNFTHKKLELIPRIFKSRKSKANLSVLEVGAGAGQHLKFVKNTYAKYTMTDINASLLSKNTVESKLKKIEFKIADVQKLPFVKGSFDRVISTCLLHHLNDVEKALLELKRVTKSDGLISIYLSCDPGLLNRLLRRLLVIPKARKLGFNEYEVFIAREHRNHFQSIKVLIQEVFKDHEIQLRYFPFRIKSWNLNTFCIIQIQIVSN